MTAIRRLRDHGGSRQAEHLTNLSERTTAQLLGRPTLALERASVDERQVEASVGLRTTTRGDGLEGNGLDSAGKNRHVISTFVCCFCLLVVCCFVLRVSVSFRSRLGSYSKRPEDVQNFLIEHCRFLLSG